MSGPDVTGPTRTRPPPGLLRHHTGDRTNRIVGGIRPFRSTGWACKLTAQTARGSIHPTVGWQAGQLPPSPAAVMMMASLCRQLTPFLTGRQATGKGKPVSGQRRGSSRGRLDTTAAVGKTAARARRACSWRPPLQSSAPLPVEATGVPLRDSTRREHEQSFGGRHDAGGLVAERRGPDESVSACFESVPKSLSRLSIAQGGLETRIYF